eukprot:14917882-Ditylum_brightwellii.AAC.2
MVAPDRDLIPMHSQAPMPFVARIAPWDVHCTPNIIIETTIPDLSKILDNKKRKDIAGKARENHGSFHKAFWMDASVLASGVGGAACITISNESVDNAYKKQKTSHQAEQIIIKPAGCLVLPSEAEGIGLNIPSDEMIENKEEYQGKRVMIGMDLQSCLKALALGPLCPFYYLGLIYLQHGRS